MNINDMVELFNNGFTLTEIGKKVGCSKSTIQRNIAKGGWILDKKTNKYINNVSRETIENDNNVSRETTINGNIVNRTYGIPSDLDKALKIKCAIEGTNATEVVRKALSDVVEQKYFDLADGE